MIHPAQKRSKNKIITEYLEQKCSSYFHFHFTVTILLFVLWFSFLFKTFPWNSIFMLFSAFFSWNFPVIFLWCYGEKYKHIYLISILLTRMQAKYSPIFLGFGHHHFLTFPLFCSIFGFSFFVFSSFPLNN